jgi:threonyl-tRNA synthetase
MMKIPLLAVIGQREAELAQVSLRSRRDGDLGTIAEASLLSAAAAANAGRLASLPLAAPVLEP